LNVERLEEPGIDTYGIGLTRQRFAVPVVRVIAPGLRLEPPRSSRRDCGMAIARTSGGATCTDGVALI
jgi:ribosomal protein S12 methylthiotransferase accessory factor